MESCTTFKNGAGMPIYICSQIQLIYSDSTLLLLLALQGQCARGAALTALQGGATIAIFNGKKHLRMGRFFSNFGHARAIVKGVTTYMACESPINCVLREKLVQLIAVTEAPKNSDKYSLDALPILDEMLFLRWVQGEKILVARWGTSHTVRRSKVESNA